MHHIPARVSPNRDLTYHIKVTIIEPVSKAGALASALKTVNSQLILILDADFIPPTDLLKNTIHYFSDPKVGMVQTRWGHLNRSPHY